MSDSRHRASPTRPVGLCRGKGFRFLSFPLLVLAFAGGCRSIPFEPVARCSMEAQDSEAVRAAFAATAPRRYRQVNSVVFSFGWNKMTALGMLGVDLDADTFRLSCMTPVGVKLFDFVGKGDETSCLFAVDKMADRPEITASVGADIHAVYMDVVPDAAAAVRRRSETIVYRSERDESRIEHTFTGTPPMLVEKRLYEQGKLVRRARYYAYAEENGQHYPQGIVLDNKRYHYRLIIRAKEMMRD